MNDPRQGGSGAIGGYVLRELIEAGNAVSCFSRTPPRVDGAAVRAGSFFAVTEAFLASWSFGLLRTTSDILLDRQGPESIRDRITHSIEQDGDSKVTDLHLWSIGPDIYSALIAVVAHRPAMPGQYKERIPGDLGLVHVAVEVHTCPGGASEKGRGFRG